MENDVLDVAIIGAGPSGSTLAYHLKKANSNLRVGLFDKTEFPRYKPCGGGISTDVYNYLDFNFDEVISCICTDLSLRARGRQVTPPNQQQILMVRRESFDEFLLNKAKEFGAEAYLGTEITDLQLLNSIWELKTINQSQSYKAKICVIAEGSLGKLAKKLGVHPKNRILAALEYEHYNPSSQQIVSINFDYNNVGYAWNFPKKNGQSIGIGGLMKGIKKGKEGLPQKLKEYAATFGIELSDKSCLHGHPIQAYDGYNKLAYKQLLLIGEIAGCVDPLTGEGIRPAIKSAFLASKVILTAFEKNDFSILDQYSKAFQQNIGKDYRYGKFLSYLFYRYPVLAMPVVLNNTTVQWVMDVFAGKMTYRRMGKDVILFNLKRIFKW